MLHSKEIRCNKCGSKLDVFDIQNDFSFRRKVKYGSKYDGSEVEIRLCCNCFDELIDKLTPRCTSPFVSLRPRREGTIRRK